MLNWLIYKLFKNYGELFEGDLQRSGQRGRLLLWLHYRIRPFKSVINLAHSPQKDGQDTMEEAFCKKYNIRYVAYKFGSGGPGPNPDTASDVLDELYTLPRPTWVHCEGGKDRTGGIVMRYMLKKGCGIEEVIRECEKHETPAEGWLRWALEEYKGGV